MTDVIVTDWRIIRDMNPEDPKEDPKVIKGVWWADEQWDDIIEIHPGVWLVPKGSAPGSYIMNDNEEYYKCNCPYSKHTGKICYHYWSVRSKCHRSMKCVKCRNRFRFRELKEVHDCEHPAYYPGDRLCLPCYRREGIY